MGTSKKQRGKQRKAAKNQATSAVSTSTTNIPNGLELEALVTERYALLISMGDHDATTSLCQSEQTVTPIAKSGILSTVLSFIQQCENDTFDNVVLSAACAARAAGVGALRYSGMLKSDQYFG